MLPFLSRFAVLGTAAFLVVPSQSFTSFTSATPPAPFGPVVIIPGDGSNQLEAKLDKKSSPHFFCDKKSDWFRLWLTTTSLLPGAVDCWSDNIRLVVDGSGHATNSPGVTTRVPDWGSTTAFEELDPSLPGHASAAFRDMVLALLGDASLGLEKNVTLVGAPYDFRYTPDSPQGLSSTELAALVERAVAAAGGKPATVISHSMGGLQGLYFLSGQPAAWKAKYIRQWIPISTPWIGAAKEFRLFATGDNEGIPFVAGSSIRDEQRSYETNHWLLPHAPTSTDNAAKGWRDTVFVETDSRNYTTADYPAFFEDIGYAVGKLVRPRVHGLVNALKAPDVPVRCFYSTGVDTPSHFRYSGTPPDFSKNPVATNSDGDGTVPEASLAVCAGWGASNVKTQTWKGIDHAGMITDKDVISAVVSAIKAV